MIEYKVFSFRNGEVVKGYQSFEECAMNMGVTELKMNEIINKKKMLNGLTFRLAEDISDFLLDIYYAEVDKTSN